MPVLRFVRIALLAGAMVPALAAAQAPAPAAATTKRVYAPADFARFAPKTAYDMLAQVPSFTIKTTDNSQRGLGQAQENVLINGERIANKSGGAVDQLKRISATAVERIEIVDAASLGIAGLSGQVANVILKTTGKSTGQFEWNPSWRAHYAKPEWLGGSVSYAGKEGPVDYTFSAKNDYGRGAFGGPIWISNAAGAVTETRKEIYHSEYEQANLQAKFGIDGPGSSVANLTLGYTPYWNPVHRNDERLLTSGERRHRTNVQKLDGYFADINGDYEFALGPGRLKLIGVRHWEHEPLTTTQILTFDTSGADATGNRFDRDTHIGETIGRAEYHWKGGRNDWQLSFERAFNSLDQKGALFDLDPSGEFVDHPFPEGTGKVTETRYEGIATWSRPLTSSLDLQVAAGAEISKLDRTPDDQPARKFFRPKGSVTFGWRPATDWDVSLKLRRRVGQISFYDFLAQPQLNSDRENAGNPDLVPPQSWEAETEISHELGRWGKTRLRTWYHLVEDIVDVIPIGDNGEGIGNLPHARRYGFESVSTLNGDPLGWTGAKLDLTLGREWTSVKDPLTAEKRPISGVQDWWMTAQVRHDIPGTPLAWSAYGQYRHYEKNFFLTEVYRSLDLPWMVGGYIEHKNVLGMTVRFNFDNILNGRHLLYRHVYTGYRDRSPLSFYERHNQLVGPLFSLSVKGTF
ncbi:MAG: TonB-dependent receptor plug domain-containing protein [Sphingomicrobium sp.]